MNKISGLKRIPALILLLLMFFCLTGLEFFKDVELSLEKPLIDLYGSESPENYSDINEEINSEEGEGISETGKNTAEPEAEERKATYTVNVKGKTVTFNGRACEKDELSGVVNREAKRGSNIILRDDYAEYFTYNDVKEILNDFKDSKGITVTEKTVGE